MSGSKENEASDARIAIRVNTLFTRVQRYEAYVRSKMEAWEASIDLDEPISCMLDASVCIFKMMILGRDTCDRYGVMDQDIGYMLIRAKESYGMIERLVHGLDGYRGVADRTAVMHMKYHAGTQTDNPKMQNKKIQTVHLWDGMDASQTSDATAQTENKVQNRSCQTTYKRTESISCQTEEVNYIIHETNTQADGDATVELPMLDAEEDALVAVPNPGAALHDPDSDFWHEPMDPSAAEDVLQIDNAYEIEGAEWNADASWEPDDSMGAVGGDPNLLSPPLKQMRLVDDEPGSSGEPETPRQRSRRAYMEALEMFGPNASGSQQMRSEVHVMSQQESRSNAYMDRVQYKQTHPDLNTQKWEASSAYRALFIHCADLLASRCMPRNMFGKCRFCFLNSNDEYRYHTMHKCWEFKRLGRNERIVWVEAMGLCHNCLSNIHTVEDCQARDGCSCDTRRCQCNAMHKHNSLLCGGNRINMGRNHFGR
jgi:hypothetical protein